ncbi:MAG: lytic transglycosylase domain-containing protein [Microbacterium sp.]
MTSHAALTPTPDREPSRRSLRRAQSATPGREQRWSRRRGVLSAFAVFAVAAFAAANVLPVALSTPQAEAAELDPLSLYASTIADAQAFLAASDGVVDLGRDGMVYTVYVTPTPTPTETTETETETTSSDSTEWTVPIVSADPTTAQAVAYAMVQARGWGDDEFACLVALWNKESGWRVNAYNSSSGAYGIPQALPGSKMASAGSDWETNPATQITWGLDYISGRYGTPCVAWSHSESSGWY